MPSWSNTNSVPARGNILGNFVPARYVFVIVGLFAMIVVYGIQLDLSIPSGAKDMVSTAKSRKGGIFDPIREWIPILNNDTCRSFSTSGIENATVGWSEPLQGTLFSGYLLGYIISQIPAAYVAERVSAKYVMVFSLTVHVACLLLMTIADQLHCSLMIVIRIVEGIAGGVVFPTLHALLASWAPKNELTRMSAVIYSGTSLGIAFSILSTGYTLLLGTVSILLIIGCIYLIQDTPNKQPLMGLSERNYINSSSGVADRSSVPWNKIFTSLPFLAILVAHTCFYWGWYTILIGTSAYFEQVLDFNIKENAIASVPFFTMWLFSLLLSQVLDKFCESDTTKARKIATLIASVVPMICLLLICFVGYSPVTAGIIMGIGITSLGGMFCGFLVNHIDIAPTYAGTLMAITNTVATIPAIILPFFIDAMTQGNPTIGAWRIIFFVAVAFYIVGIIVYLLYGSGDLESWNGSNAIELNTVSYDKTNDETSPFRGEESKSYDHR